MHVREMRRIINAFMRVVYQLNDNKRILTNKAPLAHPISLLPYPKDVIEEALDKALFMARDKQDRILLRKLEQALLFLESFVEDEKAEKQNEKLLNNRAFWTDVDTLTAIEVDPKSKLI